MTKYLFFYLVLILLSISNIVDGAVIAGKITACERNSNIEAEMKCAEKLSVSVTLTSGDSTELQYTIPSITKNDVTVPLSKPIQLKITQQNYNLIYPLTYVKTFNAKPTERIVYKKDILVPTCKDSPSSSQPTCGWMVDSRGQNIPDSQGFCCSCTFSDALGSSRNDPSTRAGINCRKIIEKQSSAHCLQMHDINYLGFQPESPVSMYQIKIEVAMEDESQKKTLTLSPKNKIQSTDGMGAELVGNFATFEQVQSFSNMMFFVADGSNEIANEGAKYYMLIDKQYVSLSGSDCDRIGSLYSAFRNQANACEKKPMSCLQNQLLDFHNSDLQRIKQKLPPLYHLPRYGKFDLTFQENKAALVMTPKEIPTAMINLMIDAASITSIISTSTGKILSAELQSLSIENKAQLEIVFVNTGSISATFRVSVECTKQVLGTQVEQRAAVDASEKGVASFDMHSATKEQSTGTCTILLQDMLARVLDQKEIKFDTLKLVPKEGDKEVNQDGTKKEKGGSGSIFDNLFGGSSEGCKSCKVYNIACKVINVCIKDIIIMVAILAGLVIFVIVFAVFLYFGGFRLLALCCNCCFKGMKISKGCKRKKSDSDSSSDDSDTESSDSSSSSDDEWEDIRSSKYKTKHKRKPRSRQTYK